MLTWLTLSDKVVLLYLKGEFFMNKEYISSKIISKETGKEMVIVTNENGELEFRESLKELPEILENENLKEKIEALLKEYDVEQSDIEEKLEMHRGLRKKISNNSLIIVSLITCLLVTYILLGKSNIELSMIAGSEKYVLAYVYLLFGGVSVGEVVQKIKIDLFLKRKKIANEAIIKLLNHHLDKTNTRLEKLKQESMLEDGICYNITKVNTTRIKNLEKKLRLINDGCLFPNSKFEFINETSLSPKAIFTFQYKGAETKTVYTFKKVTPEENVMDEQEKIIVTDCMNKCRNIGTRRVLRKN